MFTWKRFLLAVAGIFVLVILGTVTVVPGIIKNKASQWVADETGRSLTIEAVSINPFSLSLEIGGLRLSELNHEETFVSWEKLRLSLSIASVFRRAPIIDELTLVKPEIRLERLNSNTFNFSDLIPTEDESKEQAPASEPSRFSINNIAINNGKINVYDNSFAQPVHHRIEELQLVLPSIGNLPYMIENPAQPLLSAIINDAPFNIEGQVKPFTDIQEMMFNIKLDNKSLPHYLDYVPVELPVDLRNGKLNLDLKVFYRISPQTGSELELSGKADLVSLDIWDRQQEKLFFLPLLQVQIAPSQLLKQELHLSALRIYNLEVQLNRDQQGVWNHARMATTSNTPGEEVSEDQESAPFKLQIDTIELRDGTVFFADSMPNGGFKTVAREINIDVKDFSLAGTSGIPVSLSLETERKEAVRVNGQFTLQPFALDLHNEVDRLALEAYQPYYQDFYRPPLGGVLNLKADLLINDEKPLLISNADIALQGLIVTFNEQEGVTSELVEVKGLSFDLAQNRLVVGSAGSEGTAINFSRNRIGDWSFISANFPFLAEPAEKPASQPAAQSAGPAFSFQINDLAIANWDIDFKDDLPAEPAHLKVKNLAVSMQNLSLPEKQTSPVDFSAELLPGGKATMTGMVNLAEQSARLSTNLQQIPLKPFGPYLHEQTNLVLTDGRLNAQVDVQAAAGENLDLNFAGKAGVNRMHLLDGTHREDLLKWDSLQLAGIKGQLEPIVLEVDSITLSDYFAKVLIDEDARVNLVDAFNKDAGAGDEHDEVVDEPSETAPLTEDAETTSPSPDIRIGKVVLQGGRVDFTDRSLPSPFHADMTELGGSIDGLSSRPESRATVDLRGSLRNQSPLNISGQLNPLAEDIFLDIELSFRDIEMTPFSSYTGNYVGYLIEKGKLNLSLDYLVENNQLKATNKVFLDQFDFGASVESENAISLPVKLAVALLKDGKGEIHLDIPVYGSLDDPQFSIGSVVWTVIKNLLIKAATSPFALLGALIGGGEEDFSSISFDYGLARLSTSEQDKLLRMAQALVERPSLDVEISGCIDPDKDPEGYRKESLAAKVRRLKYLDMIDDGTLPEGTKELEVIVPPEEYADYLWDVYKEEDFPKPRNFIGMTKKLPESEMEKLIYTNTDVSENALDELAQARALVVQNFLIENGQLPKERIFLKKPDILAPPEEETATRARVELGASVK